ncbi:hypothetical protein F132_11 [Flavobacterium sp. phage 1/32]|nr:hypothetical protein F132_11 [Flavobacterium sp. phage 1/32]
MIKKTVKKKIPIYFGNLVMLLVEEMEDVNEKYKIGAKNSYASLTWTKEKKSGVNEYFIAVQRKTDNSVIAHEVVHIVNYIFTNNGVELDRFNDEAQAYLTGWVFGKIEKFLKKNK